MMDAAPGLDSGARPDAARRPMGDPSSSMPADVDGSTSEALTPDGPDAGEGAEETRPADLLFPSNCMAPWEETSKYHPDGYAAAKVHGLESNLNKDNCASCHGAKLDGCANSPSCDNCHDGGHRDGWRRDCKYCHGGDQNDLGAPPRDIDGISTEEMLSFIPHTVHATTNGDRHRAYGCETCHMKYVDALDPGHMYDDTPERAEVTFEAGIGKGATYDAMTGSCGNIYCHGDGHMPKATIKHTDPELTCSGCHSETPQTGAHATHSFGFVCSECHGLTVDDRLEIVGPDNHVNGKIDLNMPDNNMNWDGSTCNGVCHILVLHVDFSWEPI